MLQMIILFIMTSVVVVTGLVAVSQAQIQTKVQEYTLINQRLDAAAKAVEQTVKEYPGMIDVGVLAPELNINGMPIIPTAMGTARTTPWGSFFRYCPLANQNARTVMDNTVITEVSPKQGEISYNVVSYRGTVIYDNISEISSNYPGLRTVKAQNGAAIITAPSKPNDVAPSCDSVRFVNNKPKVTNGFVRVVNFPNEIDTSGDDLISRKSLQYFVSQTGSGDVSGTNAANTAPVIAVLSDLAASNSNEISINIVGTISPPWSTWNNFITNSAIGRRVYIEGGEIIIPTNPGSTNNFPIFGNWEMKNIIISNGIANINSGSKLSLSGQVIWRTNSAQRISINNLSGGRFDVYSANVEFQLTPQTNIMGSIPLSNNGEMNFKDSNIWIAGGAADYIVSNEGEIYSKNSKIGTQINLIGQRPSKTGILFIGSKAKLISVGLTYVIGSSATASQCWQDANTYRINTDTYQSYIAKWAQSNTYGSTLSIPPETSYVEPPKVTASTPAADAYAIYVIYSNYVLEASERRRARENASGITVCA